ncbi:MAG: type II toxin-antitoxin system Phd/YefM family antitoxin [Elusimicrobia bacterium]|nr:type II toxin-antitoxin system Phd/YefM family antitoxin [Elusimicrobiota bacterium]
MDKIIPISDLQSKAKKYVDQVKKTSEPVVITQRGRAAAVLVNYDDFEGIMAAQQEMSFPDWRKRLERARKESAEGKGLELDAYLRKRKRRG